MKDGIKFSDGLKNEEIPTLESRNGLKINVYKLQHKDRTSTMLPKYIHNEDFFTLNVAPESIDFSWY